MLDQGLVRADMGLWAAFWVFIYTQQKEMAGVLVKELQLSIYHKIMGFIQLLGSF